MPRRRSAPLAGAIRRHLAASADPDKAEPMRAYMKSAMRYRGVQTPLRRRIVRDARRELPIEDASAWEAVITDLWDRARFREERYAAIDILTDPKTDRWQSWKTLPLYERLIVEGAWWDLVDAVAVDRLDFLHRISPAATARRMRTWARGKDMWKRRSAIISQLRRKEETDVDLLYDCIEPSIGSAEFFLRKAIGWALRQHSYVDEREVIGFVRERADDLSGLSKREALKPALRAGRVKRVP